ncbi:MAG: HAD family hydrolase [Asgard group archaeon]|nr:HAD family hydrolase [Asgard group archaeon]
MSIMAITTILLDMDSTLNKIDEIAFSQEYFQLLHENYFSEFDLQFFYETLTEITRNVMLSKNSKELTVNTFMKELSKSFKKPAKKIYEKFKTYYTNEYSNLKKYVKPAKYSKKAVKLCFEKEYTVIIATTPIFTEHAIMQRLNWSGVADFNYKLITHAENMHFSKPREEYYLEIQKKMKLKSDECIMIGNEFLADIVAPTKLGMKTFYCTKNNSNDDYFISPELKRFSKIKPTYSGTLGNFIQLIKDGLE